MSCSDLRDIRAVRKALGKSQSELAALVGISTRAIQSYEQGWRPTPPLVHRLALLLLFLSRRKDNAQALACWQMRHCSPDVLANCPASQFNNGNLCWLVTGTLCHGKRAPSWRAKMSLCETCPVFQQHFHAETKS